LSWRRCPSNHRLAEKNLWLARNVAIRAGLTDPGFRTKNRPEGPAASRRVDRMVEEGLVERKSSDSDGRGVVVRLTEAGMARLAEAVPVHLEGVSKLFLERLDDQDLAVLERALDEVSLTCSYG
jgi:hypothetical protein